MVLGSLGSLVLGSLGSLYLQKTCLRCHSCRGGTVACTVAAQNSIVMTHRHTAGMRCTPHHHVRHTAQPQVPSLGAERHPSEVTRPVGRRGRPRPSSRSERTSNAAAAAHTAARGKPTKRFHTQKISSILKIFVCVHKTRFGLPRRRSSPRPCWSPRLRWIGTLSCAADTPCCAARRQQACSSPKFRAAASSFGRQVGTASPSRGEAATEHADGECPPTPKCPACTRSPSAGAHASSPSEQKNAICSQRVSLRVHQWTAPHRAT